MIGVGSFDIAKRERISQIGRIGEIGRVRHFGQVGRGRTESDGSERAIFWEGMSLQ